MFPFFSHKPLQFAMGGLAFLFYLLSSSGMVFPRNTFPCFSSGKICIVTISRAWLLRVVCDKPSTTAWCHSTKDQTQPCRNPATTAGKRTLRSGENPKTPSQSTEPGGREGRTTHYKANPFTLPHTTHLAFTVCPN